MGKYNYVSLFSGGGVGCYGFTMEGFNCVATNEVLKRRLEIQKHNNKCMSDDGYVLGDITDKNVSDKIYKNINVVKNMGGDIDVIVATPPCQGMSTANYKKNSGEIVRNSLVVEAIHFVKNVEPNVFIFENVKSFMKTFCVDVDGSSDTIEKTINKHLSQKYHIYSKVLNFKDYGIPSSRPRTLVIGTSKKLKNISPLCLYPDKKSSITIKDIIGDLPELDFGEIHKDDIYHFFRTYPEYMRSWITGLKPGESAFDNQKNKPYKIVSGEKVQLKGSHLGNKFRRLEWENPAACITTRNDQLASQSTIHPEQDRVLSIRELMRLMTIPEEFKWTDLEINNINEITDKKNFLKKEELNIRRTIGEAVPTQIFRDIARRVSEMLDFEKYVAKNLKKKPLNNFYIESFDQETALINPKASGSFYTPQSVVFELIKEIEISKTEIKILEPSVGMGAFLPQLINKFSEAEKISIDVFDIDDSVLVSLKKILEEKFDFNEMNIEITYYNCDFLDYNFNDKKYDLVIGNPPFYNLVGEKASVLRKKYKDNKLKNIFGFFLHKVYGVADKIAFITPKSFIMTPEYNVVRKKYENYGVQSIIDYGVHFFPKVFIEILSIFFDFNYSGYTNVENKNLNLNIQQPPKYIFHDVYWIIYRNHFFDEFIKGLELDFFNFFRDRQITNKALSNRKSKIWVLRSKNITLDGDIIHIDGYDKYISDTSSYKIHQYLNTEAILFVNFTYLTRASRLPNNTIPNGSIAILEPKFDAFVSDSDLKFYSTSEFREYYSIVKNYSKFTINVDKNSVYYIGFRRVKDENCQKS